VDNVAIKSGRPSKQVRPECKEAVRRLSALTSTIWLREAETLQLFPSDAMLVGLADIARHVIG